MDWIRLRFVITQKYDSRFMYFIPQEATFRFLQRYATFRFLPLRRFVFYSGPLEPHTLPLHLAQCIGRLDANSIPSGCERVRDANSHQRYSI